MRRKYLVTAGLILSILLIISVKIAYVTQHQRYIVFGFDSARIMSYAQSLKAFGELDYNATNRWGLPLTAAVLAVVFNLAPSQMMLIPLWLINLGGLIVLMAFVYQYTSFKLSALLAGWITVIITGVGLVNDFTFMISLVMPLRLMSFYWVIKSGESQSQISRIIWYFLIGLFANFTYTIIAILIDVYIFTATWIWVINQPRLYKLGQKLLAINLVNYGLILLVVGYRFNYQIPWHEYINRLYAAYAVDISKSTIGNVVISFLILHIISILIWSSYRMIDAISRDIKKTYHKYLQHQIKPGVYLICLGIFVTCLNRLRQLVQKFSIGAVNDPVELLNGVAPLMLDLTFVLVVFAYKPFSRSTNINIRFMTAIGLFYLVLKYSPVAWEPYHSVILNGRFYGFFGLCIFTAIVYGLAYIEKSRLFILILVLSISALPASFVFIKTYYAQGNNIRLAQAMDWLATQPHSSRYLVYAWYMISPNLASHEKYHSMSFVANQYPWNEVKRIGQCEWREVDCVEAYKEYIHTHQVKYLIIEDTNPPVAKQLQALGTPIYDQGIIILKL